ncbi:MAG: hypothetical protein ACOX1O_07485 [Eggerthellaceae bacterium]
MTRKLGLFLAFAVAMALLVPAAAFAASGSGHSAWDDNDGGIG